MATRRNRRTRRVAYLAIVAGVAALIYLTKPGPSYSPVESGAAPDPATAPAAHEADEYHEQEARPTKSPDAGNPPVVDAGAASGRPDAGRSAAPAAPSAASAPAEHDANAVVRSKESLVAAARERPRVTPNWREPIELTFGDIRRTYRGYRKQKDFAPEVVARLNGAAVSLTGALMPIDPVGKAGRMKRFWLANRLVVMAGCVFCNPPTMGDLVYVKTRGGPLKVDREQLYRSVLTTRLLGRLELGPFESKDGVQYLFGLELRRRLE